MLSKKHDFEHGDIANIPKGNQSCKVSFDMYISLPHETLSNYQTFVARLLFPPFGAYEHS